MRKTPLILIFVLLISLYCVSAGISFNRYEKMDEIRTGNFSKLNKTGTYGPWYQPEDGWSANFAASTNFTIFNESSGKNYTTIFGTVRVAFRNLKLNLSQGLDGDNITLLWEWSAGGSQSSTPKWSTLNVTGNVNLTKTGVTYINFTPPTYHTYPSMSNNRMGNAVCYGCADNLMAIRVRIMTDAVINQSAIQSSLVLAGNNQIMFLGDATQDLDDAYQADVANGWGVVTNPALNFYRIERAGIMIGGMNGTDGHFQDDSKILFFYLPPPCTGEPGIITTTDASTAIFGDSDLYYDNIHAYNGMTIYAYSAYSIYYGYNNVESIDTSSMKFHNAKMFTVQHTASRGTYASWYFDQRSTSTMDFIDCDISDISDIKVSSGGFKAQRTRTFNSYYTYVMSATGLISDIFEDLSVVKYSKSAYWVLSAAEVTFKNAVAYREAGIHPREYWTYRSGKTIMNVINPQHYEDRTGYATSGISDEIRLKFGIETKVLYENSSVMEGANVTLYDNTGAIVYSNLTGASGTIPEQIVNSKLFTYGALSDADYSPFTMKITKDNYLDYETNFTLDEAVDWKITLSQPPIIIDGTLVVKPDKTLVIKSCD